jgi:hypothetical protein
MEKDKIVNLNEKLGKRIISNLNKIPEIVNSIKDLENLCDTHSKDDSDNYGKEGWAREMILEWAYAGCVSSGINGGDYKKRLEAYTGGIKKILEHNKYSDPVFYVQEVFNAVFK